MAGKKKTRQSNREYTQKIREERYRAQGGKKAFRDFRVVPQDERKHKRQDDVNSQWETRKKPSGQAGTMSQRSESSNGQRSRRYDGQRSESSNGQRSRRYDGQHSESSNGQRSRRYDGQHSEGSNGQRSRRYDGQHSEGNRYINGGAEKRGAKGFNPPKEKKQQVYFEYTLVFIVVFLVMFGLLMLYTASIYTSGFFVKQCMFTLLGLAAMFVVSHIDYHIYFKKNVLLCIAVGSVILVLLVKTSLGVSLNGASRWVDLGFTSIQPAEIFKIALIIINSFLLTRYTKHIGEIKVCAAFALMAALECLFILVVTQNLSSGLIIGMITILMLFVAHPGYKVFVTALVAGGAAVAGILYYILNFVDPSKDFRFSRIYAWLAPERLADQSKLYQANQALYSIGSGGLWGKGLGAGTQKMFLPEAMNDMIFAIICEELGMIGAFLVLVMFAILLYRLVFIARNSKDLLGGMLAVGIFAHFMLQVSLNIGVVTGLLPSTGVTLPFISYGGTAQVLLLAEIGIALNVSRQIDFEMPKLKRRKVKRMER